MKIRRATSSKRRAIPAIDHKAIRRVIRRRLAHRCTRRCRRNPYGSPKRRTGMRGITLATNFSLPMMPAVMSLLIQPGRIAFAVTPWRASSTASARHQRVQRGLGRRRSARCARCRTATPGSRSRPAGRTCRRPRRALGHVARGCLKHVEDAVEIGREHGAPFFLGAVDEGAAVRRRRCRHWRSSRRPGRRCRASPVIAAFTEAGSETSQTCVLDLAGPSRHGCAPAPSCSSPRCGPRSRRCSPCAFSACAMPRPMPPLPPVMTAVRPERSKMLIGVFPICVWGAISRCARWRADVLMQPWTTPRGKIKYGRRDIRFDLSRATEIARKHKS